MMVFGPFERVSSWGDVSWEPTKDAGGDLPSLCGGGIEEVFPDLDVKRYIEFRLYTQRPRAEAFECDLVLGRTTYDQRMDLFVLYDEDEEDDDEEDEEGDRAVLAEFSIPRRLHDSFVKEFGVSWDDVPEPTWNEMGKQAYTVFLRAIELGPVEIEIDDVDLDTWDKTDEEAELVLTGSNGSVARITVDLSSVTWKDE
jgi:hypothetical protein